MTDQVKEEIREEERSDREERTEPRLSTADIVKESSSAQAVRKPKPEEHPLLAEDKAGDFRSHWDSIQTGFVDEPRKAVEQADSLVAEVMQYLAKTFADERQNLESQWGRGNDVSTEDLRIALQRYRSFFSRLLSV